MTRLREIFRIWPEIELSIKDWFYIKYGVQSIDIYKISVNPYKVVDFTLSYINIFSKQIFIIKVIIFTKSCIYAYTYSIGYSIPSFIQYRLSKSSSMKCGLDHTILNTVL